MLFEKIYLGIQRINRNVFGEVK